MKRFIKSEYMILVFFLSVTSRAVTAGCLVSAEPVRPASACSAVAQRGNGLPDETVGAQSYVVIYPYGNGYMSVLGYKYDQWWKHSFKPEDEANAFDFQAVHVSDSAGWRKSFPYAGVPNPFPEIAELVGLWTVDTLSARYGRKAKASVEVFLRDLRALVGDSLRVVEKDEPATVFHVYDNLYPFTYCGVHCQLLWDDVNRCSRTWANESSGNSSISYFSYDFDYSFREAKQVALCRYSPECYVLLLLTQPMVAMD
ncbi:MAG: hypothetical protein ACOYJE_08315 [Bacteroidaceae bacterium]|jgi:hypothetical protein